MVKKKIIVAVTGASGAIYAKVLLGRLKEVESQLNEIAVVFSENAKDIWLQELNEPVFEGSELIKVYKNNDFYASFASGSSDYDSMIVCPCSMGVLSRIANGISNDLITRAADVILKEKRKLVLLTRETPLSSVHINNMKLVNNSGGIIFPACPSFYSNPKNLNEMAMSLIDRVLDLVDVKTDRFIWGE